MKAKRQIESNLNSGTMLDGTGGGHVRGNITLRRHTAVWPGGLRKSMPKPALNSPAEWLKGTSSVKKLVFPNYGW